MAGSHAPRSPRSGSSDLNHKAVARHHGVPPRERSLLLRILCLQHRGRRDRGIALPLAIVVALALFIGIAALSSRNVMGLFASAFQGQNRAARDTAESAITAFMTTLNQEQNRYLLVAGNDELGNWSSGETKHRNPCTLFEANGDPVSGQTREGIAAAYAAGTMSDAPATTADQFIPGGDDDWQNLDGDASRQFRVESIQYLYEAGDTPETSTRTEFDYDTENVNFDDPITVRNTILQGGTRSLVRVTVRARVLRDGKVVSESRIAREMEVVPKCCKRSFGGNTYGGLTDDEAWGGDTGECKIMWQAGGDNGIVTGMNGGGPTSSNNRLDIRDENDVLVVSATCRSGADDEQSILNPSITTTAQSQCDNSQLTLGGGNANTPSISFYPKPFDLTLPRPWFGLKTYSGSSRYPLFCSGGNLDFAKSPGCSGVTVPSGYIASAFSHYYNNAAGDYVLLGSRLASNGSLLTSVNGATQNWLRNNSYYIQGSNSVVQAPTNDPSVSAWKVCPTLSANTISATQCNPPQPSGWSSPVVLESNGDWELNNDYTLYIEPASSSWGQPFVARRHAGGTRKYMPNCIVSREAGVQMAVADCYFRSIDLDGNDLTVDTTHGKINFHFYDKSSGNLGVNDEYIDGNGNDRIIRVHCDRANASIAPGNCTDPIKWNTGSLNFQSEDPDGNHYYDVSELFNIFVDGVGLVRLNGSAAAVGLNLVAPFASVELIGGGSACSKNSPEPNFMGRLWVNNLRVVGDTCIRVDNSLPAFCRAAGLGGTESCGEGKGLPIFDVAVRSYTQSSGF